MKLGRAERAILTVLAQYPQGRTHNQVALLTGYRPTASTIGVAMSRLRAGGLVVGWQATEAGLAALGPFEPLPTGRGLLEHWQSQLGRAERAVLALMVAHYPKSLDHATVCEATGYSPDASTVGVALSKLRRLEIVDGWRLSDDFAAAVGL